MLTQKGFVRPTLILLSSFFFLALFGIGVTACGCSADDDDDDAAPIDDTADDTSDDDDADDDSSDDTSDDTGDDDTYWPGHLIPGPGEDGYDADLEALARLYDREFHVFNAAGMDLSSDVVVPEGSPENRELVREFLQETDGWDFETWSGVAVFDVVTEFQNTTGLYSGVGIAADAFRYGVLRDQGYDAEEIALAREHLKKALDGLHIATAITGVSGVIARGYQKTDIPSSTITTTPLFDNDGHPLPTEKDNGTWRDDNSGLYPNYVWLDSCSRDYYIGWMAAFAGAWEVIQDDPEFSDDLKDRMREDARQIGLQLKIVRPSGFDLEIIDADGRTTYHGYMNENNYDRIYIPFLPIKNGMYALMALGSVAALNYVAQDEELESYLYNTLIGLRSLDAIAADNQIGIDLWVQTNYSSINMAFMGGLLASRYLEDESARDNVNYALQYKLYDKPGWLRQPAEIGQSLFDFTYAAAVAGSTAWDHMNVDFDAEAVARGTQTLSEFETPPFFERELINCDEQEIQSGLCICEDGTPLTLLGYWGRGDKLISVEPVPMRTRPPSNYFWRSNPYEVNGGGNTGRMLPGVDFRFAYWYGRWAR